jgi:hypothetical protein
MIRPIALGAAVLCLAAACVTEDVATQQADHTEVASSSDDAGFGEELWAEIAARCGPAAADEAILHSNAFHWSYDREQMAVRFDEIYASGMRLDQRAYYDDQSESFVLTVFDSWGGRIDMPHRLVENVTRHIERALDRGYVDHVFFPDMGHSHLFVRQVHWDETYAGMPVPQIADRYSLLFDDPELLVLYHTAEQLEMLDDNDNVLSDRWVQWRFFTRNLVGDNAGKGRLDLIKDDESKANTARDLPGHYYLGAGFNISASEQGCFPYRQDGELRWYDLSMSDLPYQSDGSDDSGY